MGKKYTYEYVKTEFENRGYELISTEYLGMKEKLRYICPQHIDKGIQEIDFSHFHDRNQGCKYCGLIKNHINPKHNRTTEEDIIKHFNTLKNIKYVGCYFKRGRCHVNYMCLNHKEEGILNMEYGNILKASCLCKSCRSEANRKQTFSEDIFALNKNIEIISEYFGNDIPVTCRCKIHNITWMVTPRSLISHPTCPKCRHAQSRSEQSVSDILDEFKINYVSQKKYKDCKDKRSLPFDFYLSEYNILIEFQGEQHYQVIKRGNMTIEQAKVKFKLTQKHDRAKKKYCKNHNIPLIIIPYWLRETMDYYLFDELVKLGAIEETQIA